jgi:hypothetical protein
MGAAVPIRGDIPAEELRRLARLEGDGRVACRLLGLANVVDGMSRERAARQAGMDRQTLRDWVIRFNAEGVEGLRDRPRSGRPPWLDDGQLAAFKALVLRGPTRSATASAAGGPRICAGSSSSASASAMPRTACSGCFMTSACPGRRPGRCIRKRTAQRRRASKKISGADRRDRTRPSRRRTTRGLVPGRGPGRPDRAPVPALVPEGRAAARAARPAP